MNPLLEKLLPEAAKSKLIQLSHIYHFNQQREIVSEPIAKKIEEVKQLEHSPILFAGYIKSGNTWLRFLIYNYFNIIINKASETLSYSELNTIQFDQLEKNAKPFKGSTEGFPHLIRTHNHYNKAFQIFKKCICVYRNPLDTLVSAYHFRKDHETMNLGIKGRDDSEISVDEFVSYNLKLWELHVDSFQGNILKIKYQDLQENPITELKKVIEYMGYSFNEAIAKKSIEFSSFTSIQKMGREKNEMFGNGGVQFKGEFARKGKVGSYKEELAISTIRKAKSIFKKYGFSYSEK